VFLIGAGGEFALGNSGGSLDHTHDIAAHTHTISADGDHEHLIDITESETGGNDGAAGVQAGAGVTVAADGHTHGVFGDTMEEGEHTHGGVTGSGGSGTTTAANPPYLAVNFVIFAGVLRTGGSGSEAACTRRTKRVKARR
jgi:hypothetical protein